MITHYDVNDTIIHRRLIEMAEGGASMVPLAIRQLNEELNRSPTLLELINRIMGLVRMKKYSNCQNLT